MLFCSFKVSMSPKWRLRELSTFPKAAGLFGLGILRKVSTNSYPLEVMTVYFWTAWLMFWYFNSINFSDLNSRSAVPIAFSPSLMCLAIFSALIWIPVVTTKTRIPKARPESDFKCICSSTNVFTFQENVRLPGTPPGALKCRTWIRIAWTQTCFIAPGKTRKIITHLKVYAANWLYFPGVCREQFGLLHWSLSVGNPDKLENVLEDSWLTHTPWYEIKY